MKEIIEAMELYAMVHHIPIMEKEGIQWLRSLIQQHRITSILEIGSAIGYSAIQMASIDEGIHITTIEKDEHRYLRAVDNIEASGCKDRINLVLGDGLEYTPTQHFDLIFIDAAKAKYEQFFQRFSSYLKPGGIIVSDNMKFHGMVEDPSTIKTRGTRKLVQRIGEYQDFLKQHAFYATTFVDVGDGLAVSQRKQNINLADLDAVIFDMDGTMLDSERTFMNQSDAWNALRPLPLDMGNDFYASIIGKNYDMIGEIFKERFGDAVDYATYHNEVEAMLSATYDTIGIPLKPNLTSLLDQLKKADKKLAVATSTVYDSAKSLLSKAGLLDYFDVVVGGDMVAHSKPHPAIYWEAAKQLGVSSSRTLVIEDSNPGLESGARGGFGAIMVVDVIGPTKQSEEIAIAIFSSLSEVIDFLSEEKNA